MRNNEQGLTLIELLVVMAIAVILVVAIGLGWNRQESAAASATLTQQTLVMMRQARTRALESGGFTQVWIDATGTALTLVQSSALGLNPGTWVTVGQENATQGARIEGVFSDIGTHPSPATLENLPAIITFRPDGSTVVHLNPTPPAPTADDLQGSAIPTTILVNDGSGKNPNRVFVYSLTGFSRSVNGW